MTDILFFIIRYDLKKGIRDNLIKWLISFGLFIFFSDRTMKAALLAGDNLGFWGVWIKVLGGMPEYIKTSTSIFDLPVSWLLFYAFLFFMIGFYPISDLHSFGAKTLLLTGNRKKWMISKYIWIATQVVLYFTLFAIAVGIVCILNGDIHMDKNSMMNFFGIDVTQVHMSSLCMVCIILPIMISTTISYMQYILSIVANAIWGYIVSISLLVVSAYWMKPVFIGNYLMIYRSQFWVENGVFSKTGILISSVSIILYCILGIILFRRKDIYKIA